MGRPTGAFDRCGFGRQSPVGREPVALVQLVIPADIEPVILADPDDDIVLATAVAGAVDVIVSGDGHLLVVGIFQGIPVVTPAVAVDRMAV